MVAVRRAFTFYFFFSSRRRHTSFDCDWSSDVCSSDLSVVCRWAAVRLEEPAFLEIAEPLVEPALAPLIVGELAHDVLVPRLVHDEADRCAPVHDHHGELGPAALDAVHVGELGPLILPEQRVEPRER